MIRQVLLLVALIGCTTANVTPKNVLAWESRVVNGVPASPTDFPFQASLQRKTGAHTCGATILSADWILTAAHCVYGGTASQYQVRVGTTTYSSGGQLRDVAEVIWHEGYIDSAYWPNDVAVLRLSTPLAMGGNVQAVTLATAGSDVTGGSPGQVCGWGVTVYGGQVQEDLLKADVTIVSDAQCLADYGEGPTEPQICAGGGGTGICSGDSGGPLLYNGVQVGITSWTRIPCASIPAVWTQVSYFRDWITQKTGVN